MIDERPCMGDEECYHIEVGKYGFHAILHTHPFLIPRWCTEPYVHYIPVPQRRNGRFTEPGWYSEDVLLSAIAAELYYPRFPVAYIDVKSPLLTKGVAVLLGDLTRDDVSCL